MALPPLKFKSFITPANFAILVILLLGVAIAMILAGNMSEAVQQHREESRMLKIACAINYQLRLHPEKSLQEVLKDLPFTVPEDVIVRALPQEDPSHPKNLDFVVEKKPQPYLIMIVVYSDGKIASWSLDAKGKGPWDHL